MPQPNLEVADIFRRHGEAWRSANAGHVSLAQRRVMTAIEICRTAALGGHVERCEDCAHLRIAYNSCRNRHCNKCQWSAAQEWLEARKAELLQRIESGRVRVLGDGSASVPFTYTRRFAPS